MFKPLVSLISISKCRKTQFYNIVLNRYSGFYLIFKTSSPFELCLNEGISDVAIHTGDSFASFLPLLHIPSKPSAAYHGLGEVIKLPGLKLPFYDCVTGVV